MQPINGLSRSISTMDNKDDQDRETERRLSLTKRASVRRDGSEVKKVLADWIREKKTARRAGKKPGR